MTPPPLHTHTLSLLRSISIRSGSEVVPIRMSTSADDATVALTIAGATGAAAGTFGLKDASDGVVVSVSASSLEHGKVYDLIALKSPACESGAAVVGGGGQGGGIVGGGGGGGMVQPRSLPNGIVLSGKPARLPRVVCACLGTGRYREYKKQAAGSLALRSLHFHSPRTHFQLCFYSSLFLSFFWVLLVRGNRNRCFLVYGGCVDVRVANASNVTLCI